MCLVLLAPFDLRTVFIELPVIQKYGQAPPGVNLLNSGHITGTHSCHFYYNLLSN